MNRFNNAPSKYSHKISQDNPRFEKTFSELEQYGCLQFGSFKIMIGSFIRLRDVKRIKAPGDFSLPPPEFGLVYRIMKSRRDGPLIHIFYFNAYSDKLSEVRKVFPNKEGARNFPPLAVHDVILDRRLPVKYGIIKKENIASVESMVKIHYQDDPDSRLKESKTKYCYRFDLTFSKGFTILVPRVKLTNLEADTYSEEVLTMELLRDQMALIHGHKNVNQHMSESSTAQKNATDTKPVPDHPALDKPKKVKLRKPSNDTDDDLFDDEPTSEDNAAKKVKKVPLRKLRERESTKSKVLRFPERKSARLANLEKYPESEEEEEDDDTPEFGTSKRESQRVKNAALLLQNTKSLQEAKEFFEFVNEEDEDLRGSTNQSDNDKEFVPKRKQSNIKDFLKRENLDKKSNTVSQDTDEDDILFNTPKKNKIEKQAKINRPDSTKKSSNRMSVPETQPMIQEELQKSDDSDNVLFNTPRKNQSENTAQKFGTGKGKAVLDYGKKLNKTIRVMHSDSSSDVNEVPTSEKKRFRRISCDSDDKVIVEQVDQPSKSKLQSDKFVSKMAKMPTLMKRKVRAESSSESESGDSHEQETHKRKRLKNKRRLEIHRILSSDVSDSEAKINKLGPRRQPLMESSILSLKQTLKGKGKIAPSKSSCSAEHGSERSEAMTANEDASQMKTHVIVPIIRPEGAPIGSAVVIKVPKSISDEEFKTPPTSPQIENQSDDTPDKGDRLKNLCAQPYQSLKNLFGKQQEEYNQVINVPMDSLDGYSQLPDAELNCEENADLNREGTPEKTSENEANAGRTVTRSARQNRSPLRYKDSESSDEEEKEDSPVVQKKRGRPAFKTSVQTPKIGKGRGRPQSTVGTPKRGTSTLKRRKLATEKSDIEEQKMPGREDQMANIQDFIESRLEDQTGGCMYISGLPGTGKTASVNQVLLNLLKQRESGEIDFKLLQVSGMELTQPQQIFSRMAEILLESKMTPAIAQSSLAKYFSNKDKKRLSTILVVDELDMLCTRKQDVVYHLFEWPTKATSKLIVLTIANTMDLPERLLQGKVTSRMGLTRLTFRPYTYEQLEKIVQVKLDESGDFDSDARQLVARKVASLSGDARRALEICRRALELAENTSVQMSHVMKSLKEMLETPTVETIKNLGPLEKLFLNCMASEIQRTGVEETSLGEVIKSMRSNGLFHGVTDFTDSKISEICARLASCRLVLAEQDRAGLRQRISLNVNPDDLHYALKVSNQI
ncbi:uncharacterized protein Orc1 [Cloeon dipterum]|uniref:uncharacterized protein Orc1 n=1 Tax=Cloeon dipterum TaxID=197152 RepID=UPI00321F77A0